MAPAAKLDRQALGQALARVLIADLKRHPISERQPAATGKSTLKIVSSKR